MPFTGGCANRNLWRTSDTPRASAVRSPPNDSPPPDGDLFGRRYALPREGHPCPTIIETRITRQGFRRGSHPAPPGHANGASTALPPPRPAPAGSYLPPAPSPRHLNHPETTPGTGGTTPGRRAPSQVSVERPSASHVARVWTQSQMVCRAFPRRHCLQPPGIPGDRFLGAEYRSAPVPLHLAFSRFGLASLDGTDRQALAGLSWLSCSWPPDLPEDPGPGHGPVPTVASRELPTPARLNGPDGTSTRIAAPGGCGPNPRGGIVSANTDGTHFTRHGPPQDNAAAGLSLSPCFALRHRIERRDSSPGFRLCPTTAAAPGALHRRASVAPDEHVTAYPALRASAPLAAGEAVPFVPLVRRNFRVVPPVSMTVRNAPRYSDSRSVSAADRRSIAR